MALKLRDLVARIRILSDKKSTAETEKEVKASADRIGVAWKKVAGLIAAAFAVERIFAFAKASVMAAIESEAIWNRVGGAVERTGKSWAAYEGRVRAAAKAMRDAAGIDGEVFAEAFDRLLAKTGNVSLSLSQMGFAADIAARFYGGDLVQAADALGNILQGNIRAFRQLGIMTTDVNEGLRILRERSAGAAANELKSIEGRMRQLKEVTADAKEELGFLIIRIFGGSDTETAINRFKLGLDDIAERLARIRNNGLTDQQKASMAALQENDPVNALLGIRSTKGIAELPPIFAVAKKSSGKTKETTVDSGTRERVRQLLEAAREDRRRALEAARRQRDRSMAGGDEKDAALQAAKKWGEELDDNLANTRDKFIDTWENEIAPAAINAAYGVAGAWQDTFELLFTGAANTGKVFETLGRGIAGALLGGLSQYASGKVAENVASAVEEIAKGFAASANPFMAWSAPLHFKAAAQHGVAVGLWSVLAGATGAGQSAIAGGGRGGMSGGLSSGAADIGGRLAQGASAKNETHIYIDPLNRKNPAVVSVVGGIMKEAAATDSSINIHPYPKSGSR